MQRYLFNAQRGKEVDIMTVAIWHNGKSDVIGVKNSTFHFRGYQYKCLTTGNKIYIVTTLCYKSLRGAVATIASQT